MNNNTLRENIEKIVRATLLEASGNNDLSEEDNSIEDELYKMFAKQMADYVIEASKGQKEVQKQNNKEDIYKKLTRKQKALGNNISSLDIDEINKEAEEAGLIELSKYDTILPGLLDRLRKLGADDVSIDDFDFLLDDFDDDDDLMNESFYEDKEPQKRSRGGDSSAWKLRLRGEGKHVIEDAVFVVDYGEFLYSAGRPSISPNNNSKYSGILIQWMFDENHNPVITELQSFSAVRHPKFIRYKKRGDNGIRKDKEGSEVDLERLMTVANKELKK